VKTPDRFAVQLVFPTRLQRWSERPWPLDHEFVEPAPYIRPLIFSALQFDLLAFTPPPIKPRLIQKRLLSLSSTVIFRCLNIFAGAVSRLPHCT
jgi:hypothetical protein